MTSPQNPRTPLLLSVALAAVTVAVFAGVRHNGFIAFDDPDYVTQNPMVQQGLTRQTVAWAFTSRQYANWFPLTWLSHMLDWQLFGGNPKPHHLVNVLLHTMAALLLFHAFRRMTNAPWRSAFVAAMFAWHPLHVESVAWAAERKDVLSTLFWMLTLIAYASYAKQPGVWRYGLTLLTFALGLMSKPMLVTLSCVLLLLDHWPLRRLRLPAAAGSGVKGPEAPVTWDQTFATLRRLLLEKVPFLVLTLGSSYMTLSVQKQDAVVPLSLLPLGTRLLTSLAGYFDYLVKTVWPAPLSVFYPYQLAQPPWKVAAALLVLGGISVAAIRWMQQRPWLPVGWLWYLGTLVPVIGLVQVGEQAMADRYSYVPTIGLGILIAWGAGTLVRAWPGWRLPVEIGGAVVLAVWAILTVHRVSYWQTNQKLFEQALAVTGKSNKVTLALAEGFLTDGYHWLAEKPPRIERAKECFNQCLAVKPEFTKGHLGLGKALAMEGNYPDAILQYQKALSLEPASFEAHNLLALALAASKQTDQALFHFGEAIRLHPGFVEPLVYRARLFYQLGRYEECVADCDQALRLQPDQAELLFNKGNALVQLRRYAEAVTCYRRVLALNPQSVAALNRLAWLMATSPDASVRNGAEATQLAARACELTRQQNAESLASLAAACAEASRFEEAVRTARQALAAAQASGQSNLVSRIQNALELYQANKPFRELSP